MSHAGLPRLEDFCWIAVQEPNVYAGLAVVMPFIYTRPRYFAQVIGELLYWLGEDRLLFASDYAIWSPQWLVESFVDFQIPDDMVARMEQDLAFDDGSSWRQLGLAPDGQRLVQSHGPDGTARAAASRPPGSLRSGPCTR